jgi:hypothetical protein
MLNKLFNFLILLFVVNQGISQVIYSERFNGLSLTTATTSSSQNYLYSDVPSGMFTINNGDLIADTLTGNYPYRAIGQKQKAWLTYVPSTNASDTFAVSTSWLKPIGTASAWLITPTISVSANSVLTWESMSPDVNNADGYEVYVSTNNSATPIVGHFSSLIYSKITEANTWQTRGVSLSAFAGQTIRIAFKNNSTDKYQLWLDDIKVENISTTYDAGAVSHSNYKYSTTNTNNTISAVFKNYGATPISNLTINYKMGNGATVSEIKILSPVLNYLETREVSFSTLYNSSAPVYNDFKIWTSAINAQADQVNSNDTVAGSLTISSSAPLKKVLLEQFTGATYGWSPNAYSTLKNIVTTNTNVIAASIHTDDSLSIGESAALITDFSNGIPSATIDRFYFTANQKMGIDPINWNTYVNQRLSMKVPATVAISNVNYNSTTNQIDATVSATFVGDVKGDYRLNLYIKENNVYGPIADSSDNQWNQYNNSFSIPSSTYYQYGNMVGSNYIMSAVSYKHQYVVNNMLDGAYGGSSSIPTNGTTIGQTYSKNYSFNLPTALNGEFRYNADNVYLIATLNEYGLSEKDKTILNAEEVKLTANSEVYVGIKELEKTNLQLNLYPNPSANICHLNFNLNDNEFVKINIYNALGELVYIETAQLNAGNINYSLNVSELNSGNYVVQLSLKNNTVTKKLTIIK